MTFSIALLLSFLCLQSTLAVPVPDPDLSTCTEVTYTVDKAEQVAGKTFLSGNSCKNDWSQDKNGKCDIGPSNWYAWAAIPLLSKNLVGASSTYNLSQIAEDANGKLGAASASPVTLMGGTASSWCEGTLECGLTATPQYVHVTGTRKFGASCNVPQPEEQYEMWLPKQTNSMLGMVFEVAAERCYKGSDVPSNGMAACPDVEPWTEQIVLSNYVDYPAGEFAKLEGKSPHGMGERFRVRFNTDNAKFGTRGLKLLEAVNKQVYDAGIATAHAGNWQEWTDGLSDVAEFSFDASDRYNLVQVCRAIAGALDSVSGLQDSGKGTCL